MGRGGLAKRTKVTVAALVTARLEARGANSGASLSSPDRAQRL